MQTQKGTEPNPISRVLSAPATTRPTSGHHLPDAASAPRLQSPQNQKLPRRVTMDPQLHTTPHHDIV